MWGKHCSFHHTTLWIAIVFHNMVFFPVFFVFSFLLWFFPKLSLSILFFLILSWLEFNFVIFFKKNTVDCYSVSPHGFFLLSFFLKLSLSIFFFNIELIENYNYNKAKSCGESIIAFLAKHCGLLYSLPIWFFFLMIFLKLSLSILFF